MMDGELWILDRLQEVAKRYMSILEKPPHTFVLRKDGTFETTINREAHYKRAAQAEVLLRRYRALTQGNEGRFWWTQIPYGERLYIEGKAKPSAEMRPFPMSVVGVSAGCDIPAGTLLCL